MKKAKDIALSGAVLQAVIRKVKAKKRLEICIIESEKWNDPNPDGTQYDEPREDGHYDNEGHTNCDIYGTWDTRWWHPGDVKDWLRFCWEWLKDLKQFVLTYRTLPPYHPFRSMCSQWTWTLDSLTSYKVDLCEELAGQEVGIYEDYENDRDPLDFSRPLSGQRLAKHKAWMERGQELFESMSKTDTIKHLLKDYEEVMTGMWVNKTDPTCLIVDESIRKYDLKDGWSNKEVGKLLQLWFYGLLEMPPPPVKYLEYKDL